MRSRIKNPTFHLKSGKQVANTLFLNGVEIGVSVL